jgi:hypothetical protein
MQHLQISGRKFRREGRNPGPTRGWIMLGDDAEGAVRHPERSDCQRYRLFAGPSRSLLVALQHAARAV